MNARDQILKILTARNPLINEGNAGRLLDSALLDSFDLIRLVAELENTFKIKLGVEDISEENFASLSAIELLVDSRLRAGGG